MRKKKRIVEAKIEFLSTSEYNLPMNLGDAAIVVNKKRLISSIVKPKWNDTKQGPGEGRFLGYQEDDNKELIKESEISTLVVVHNYDVYEISRTDAKKILKAGLKHGDLVYVECDKGDDYTSGWTAKLMLPPGYDFSDIHTRMFSYKDMLNLYKKADDYDSFEEFLANHYYKK